ISITVLNLLLGWTLVGWVAALVWAYSSYRPEPEQQVIAQQDQLAPQATDAGMRECPYCAEPIRAAAIKCKHCGSDLADVEAAISQGTSGDTHPPFSEMFRG